MHIEPHLSGLCTQNTQELRNLIEHNPALRGKMDFPPIPPSALVSVFTQL